LPFNRCQKIGVADNIAVWDATRIKIGSRWRDEIQKALTTAMVSVFLVSPRFLVFDFIRTDELPPLL